MLLPYETECRIVKCTIDSVEQTAYVELATLEHYRNLLLLNGRKFGGQYLRILPWLQDSVQKEQVYEQRIACQVFVVEGRPPRWNPDRFQACINQTLRDYELTSTEGVLSCFPNKATLTLTTASPEVADHVMYLNGMETAPGIFLKVFRHTKYQGPAPKHDCFQDFQRDYRAGHPNIGDEYHHSKHADERHSSHSSTGGSYHDPKNEGEESCRVYLVLKPNSMSPLELVDFLNHKMHQQVTSERSAILHCFPICKNWCFEMKSPKLAEQLLQLNNTPVNCGTYLHLRSSEEYYRNAKKPFSRPDSSSYPSSGIYGPADDVKVEDNQELYARQIFVNGFQGSDERALRDFLNAQMIRYELAMNAPIVSIQRRGKRCVLEMITKEAAKHILYLHQIEFHHDPLFLTRHSKFDRSLFEPQFLNFEEFRHQYEIKQKHTDGNSSSFAEESPNKSIEDVTSTNETMVPPKEEQIIKQDLLFLKQVANYKLENDRLKEEISQLHQEHWSLIGDYSKLEQERAQWRTSEEQWQETNHQLRSQLADAHSQRSQVQTQLDDVHQSWQQQEQDIVDQKQTIAQLLDKLEDAQQRFHSVTESLTLQTNELANAQKQKRQLEQQLQEQQTKRRKVDSGRRVGDPSSAVKVENYDI